MAAVESATLAIPRTQLLTMIGAAVVVASVITFCFVLPAEFRIDPTGVGRATGLIRLAGPKRLAASDADALAGASATSEAEAAISAAFGGPQVNTGAVASNEGQARAPGVGGAGKTLGPSARYYAGGYRSDFVEIPLAVAGSATRGEELEYKVHMRAGDTLAYSWAVEGISNPEEFYYDFHGEAPAKDAASEATVVEYRQATGTQSHGTLVAPFDGVFGWYLQNQSEKPVVVHLKISGFYTLVPPGEYGNEAGIEANQPLAR
ncbi:MAG TPA: hypothetical protein VFS52_22220 [Steroidobacteraceae bacterium]|jgi:hypothetical protein|nr:hypothetical protein [Steroidobacteraceae bacterium]